MFFFCPKKINKICKCHGFIQLRANQSKYRKMSTVTQNTMIYCLLLPLRQPLTLKCVHCLHDYGQIALPKSCSHYIFMRSSWFDMNHLDVPCKQSILTTESEAIFVMFRWICVIIFSWIWPSYDRIQTLFHWNFLPNSLESAPKKYTTKNNEFHYISI